MNPLNRILLVLVSLAFATSALAGCLGGDEEVEPDVPRAVVKVTESADADDTFVFDGSGSRGKGLKFEWSFGDGTTSADEKVEHTYEFGDGTYKAELIITDIAGLKSRWSELVKVGSGENGAPIGDFTPSIRYLEVGEPVTVDARATADPEDDPIVYEWDFNALYNTDSYIKFRDAKKEGAPEGSGGTDVSSGDNKSAGIGIPSLPTDPFQKSPGHGGSSEPPMSLFDGRRTSTEPVFTLEEGFPDATRFFIQLTAYDVKGASKDVLSVQVWPVWVVEAGAKVPETYTETFQGTFTIGAPDAVTSETPKDPDGNYADDATHTFQVPDPVVLLYVNVTWEQNPIYESQGVAPNQVDADLAPPKGALKKDYDTGDTDISMELTSSDDVGFGNFVVNLYAIDGVDFDYTLTTWAKVDLNPFADIEKEYV